MSPKNSQNNGRLYALTGFLTVVLVLYLGVLFDTQVNHYDDYIAKSVRSIARVEQVESSRGIITDRSGRTLVTNRSTYSLTFDSSLLKSGDDQNEAILRLVKFCQEQGVEWTDTLPISLLAPYTYTVNSLTDLQKTQFLSYLKTLKDSKNALSSYLVQHPEVVPADTADTAEEDEEASAEKQAATLLDRLTSDQLTTQLLNDAGISPSQLLDWMRAALKLPESFSDRDARLVLGVRYELALRQYDFNRTAYIMVEDIDTEFISLLNDGGFTGAKVSSSSVREYETSYAAHILGTVSRIWKEDMEKLAGQGYDGNDWIGRTGAEAAFESYLKGTDGKRIVSTNSDGKITGEFYSVEPQPGNTVELTIDLKLQQTVEDALAATISKMSQADGDYSRGGAAVVEKVGTGEVLALASYPTYDLSTYLQPEIYQALTDNPGKPFNNRATSYPYAPGSTLKPLTAVAALESGVTTLKEKVRDTGKWVYPGAPNSYTNCWRLSGHGLLNVTGAITNSCNYFFAEMGYRMGMDTLREYLTAFGLGEHTGIEIGDRTGTLPENKVGENLAPWAAYGQANQEYTPLQLANYIATLVSGGKHCEAHLLKAVKSYDNSEVLAVGNTEPTNVVGISDSTLNAVKEGMHGYTLPGGMVYQYFKDCVVSAGAKTGTAQLGGDQKNNGVFVCFAPYEEPEIVISIAIEHGDSGAALASTAVNILNAYFSADEIGTAVIGENELLP